MSMPWAVFDKIINLFALEVMSHLRTFDTVRVELLHVGALRERPDPGRAPSPPLGLRLHREVLQGLLGAVEDGGAVPAAVVVLAVHPVGVHAPVLVVKILRN